MSTKNLVFLANMQRGISEDIIMYTPEQTKFTIKPNVVYRFSKHSQISDRSITCFFIAKEVSINAFQCEFVKFESWKDLTDTMPMLSNERIIEFDISGLVEAKRERVEAVSEFCSLDGVNRLYNENLIGFTYEQQFTGFNFKDKLISFFTNSFSRNLN